MDANPLVTCLIVTYNFEKFIVRAVESVLAQDYPAESLEIIVVDDGSRDRTPELLVPYMGRIKYIRKENGGLISSLNRGLAEAKGEFIGLLSGDDTWPRDKVRRQVDFLLSHPHVGLLYGDMEVIDSDDNVIHPSFFTMCNLEPRRGKILGILLKRNIVSGGALMVRASLKEVFHPIPAEAAWEDWWLAVRVAEVAEVDYLAEPVYRYRYHGDNMNLGSTGKKRANLLRIEIPFRRWLLTHISPGQVTLHERLEAFLTLEYHCLLAAQELEIPLQDLIQVTEHDKIQSSSEDAAGIACSHQSEPEGAAHHFLTALTYDPWSQYARSNLKSALQKLGYTINLPYLHGANPFAFPPVGSGQPPLVSIIIPTYNKWEYTAKCLEKLGDNTKGIPYEVIMVDNGSSDDTRQGLSLLGTSVRVQLNESNLGFGRACNQGASMARGKYLVFLNNDTEPQPGWLEAMVKVVESDSSVAIVGSKLLFPDGTIQHGGVGFFYAAPDPITPAHLNYKQPARAGNEMLELKAVTAACMLIRSEVFNAVGGFDEAFENGCEDVDLCLKVWESGGRIIYTPQSILIRHESVSEGRHLKDFNNLDLLHRHWLGRFTAFDGNGWASAQPSPVDPARPGVSIIIVTYNSLRTIAPCLESLRLHTGPQDEIILVDNASRDATMLFVNSFVMRHPGWMKVIRSSKNLGFSRGVNLGLEAASKDYVVLLNPDVQVTPGWLDRMLAHLTADPGVGAVGPTADYVAELQQVDLYLDLSSHRIPDTVSAALEERYRGQAKETPLLVGFCLLTRRNLLQELGNLDPDLFLGNDDLDLSWRLRQQGFKLLVATDVFVRHFGQVSFRTEPGSKTRYMVQQSTNLLYEKLYRYYNGMVPPGEDLWGIAWFTPQTGLTSIIVVAHNSLELTRQCLESVYRHTHRDFELILVDNGCTDDISGLARTLQQSYGNVTYVRNDENEGYAYACNQGLALARGEYVVLLHDDTVVTPGWLSRLLALLSIEPSMGVVITRSNNIHSSHQVEDISPGYDLATLVEFADEWFVEQAGQFSLTYHITGPCMVIRKEVLFKVGGFDTCCHAGNSEDGNFMQRVARAGYKVAVADDVFVYHHGQQQDQPQQEKLFLEVATRAFDPDWDYIPLRYQDVYHPAAPPLGLEDPRPVRFLCIPDWADPSWRHVVASYVTSFGPHDPVSLIVRVEPPLPGVIEKAWEQVTGLLQELRLPEAETPDIIFETTAIPPRLRGSLYTAATAFLPCAGIRAHIYAREARACDLPVIEKLSAEVLVQVK